MPPPYLLWILPGANLLLFPQRNLVIKASSDASAVRPWQGLCLTERIKNKGMQRLKPPPPYLLQSH